MRHSKLLPAMCLFAGVLPGAAADVGAELLGSSAGCDFVFMMGSTEEPDPLGLVALIHDLGFPYDLQPETADIVLVPRTTWPAVIWMLAQRSGNEVAFCEWTDEGWRPMTLLSGVFEDDRDPELAAGSDGALHAVWWQASPDRVVMRSRAANSTGWSLPRTIASNARRPSVGVSGTETLVAWEASSAVGQQVIVRTYDKGAAQGDRLVATTSRPRALDVRLHAAGGRVWVDWKHTDGLLGFAERVNGSWSAATGTIPYTPGWASEEQARMEVQALVLASDP